jgi:hypothetical protein
VILINLKLILGVLCVVFTILAASSVSGAYWTDTDSLDDELVAYWKLDETSGTIYDSTDNDHDSTSVTADYGATGKIGNAMDFQVANTDYIRVADSDDLSFTDGSGNDEPFTISAWVKPESISNYMIIVGKYDTAGTKEYEIDVSDTGALRIFLWDDGGYSAGIGVTSTSTLSSGNWYHVVTTYDGSETEGGLKIYVNGILQSTTSSSSGSYDGMQNEAVDLIIGSRRPGTYEIPFDGVMDEVGFWNRELSDWEVMQLYNAKDGLTHDFTDTLNPMLQGGLMAHYTMDESSGTIYDSTDNDNDGTYNGALYSQSSDVVGTAIGFDGSDDYIDPSIDMNSESKTISFWFKTTDTGWFDLFSWKSTSTMELMQISIDTDEYLNMNIRDSSSNLATINTGFTVNDGEWHHAVYMFDTTTDTYKGYLDGVLISIDSTDVGSIASIEPYIASRHYTTPDFFAEVTMDEVAVWNRLLTGTEVLQLYHSTNKDMSSPEPISYDWSTDTYEWHSLGDELVFYAGLDDTDDDTGGDMGLSVSSAPTNTDTDCINNNCFDYDGADDYHYTTSFHDVSSMNAMTICNYINIQDDTTSTKQYAGVYVGGETQYIGNRIRTSSDRYLQAIVNDGSNNCYVKFHNTYSLNTDYYFCTVWKDGQDLTIYVDGVKTTESTTCSGTPDITSITQDELYIGVKHYGTDSYLDGTIDEVGIWSRALSSSEIESLCAEGSPDSSEVYPFALESGVSLAPPSVSLSSPSSDDRSGLDPVALNYSVAVYEAALVNCSLFVDGVVEQTTSSINASSGYSGSFSESLSEGTHSWSVNCTHASNSSLSDMPSAWSLVMDFTAPDITLNAGNGFSTGNFSVENQYDDDLDLDVTVTDAEDLYAIQVLIYDDSDVLVHNHTDLTLSGTSHTYTETVDTSSWSEGLYSVEVWGADAHTKQEIKPYKMKKEASKLTFNTKEGSLVSVESEDDSVVEAVKELDRYTFDFSFNDNKKNKKRVFHLKSDNVIEYRPASAYAGHFIVWNGFGGNWIDFEGAGEIPDVKKVSDYHYKVTFDKMDDKVKFKSIGGLNVNNLNYTWYRGSFSNSTPVGYTGEDTTLSLTVSNHTTISGLTAELFYNNSLMAVTSQRSSSESVFSSTFAAPSSPDNYSADWRVNVTQNGNTYSFWVNETQTIEDWGIDTCAGGNAVAINFTIMDELDPSSSLSATLELDSDVWAGDVANTKEFFNEYNSSIYHEVCLFPSAGTLYSDMYVKYTVSSGFTHRYYLQNTTLTNTTQTILLYNMVNETGISDLKITLRETDTYNFFESVIGKLQKYYVGEGVWRTVQMDKSGDYGLLFFNIEEEHADYRIIFVDEQGNILETTEPMKFVCSGGLCDLTYILDEFSTSSSSSVDVVASHDNSTSITTVSWVQSAGNNVDVQTWMTKDTITGVAVICNESQSGASGTVLCNSSGVTGRALLYVTSGGESVFGEWVELGSSSLSSNLSVEEQGIVAFMLMAAIVLFGVFSPVALIIATVVSLIAVFFLGVWSAITVTGIIIAAAMGAAIAFKVRT